MATSKWYWGNGSKWTEYSPKETKELNKLLIHERTMWFGVLCLDKMNQYDRSLLL
jgi:hypothetical protein